MKNYLLSFLSLIFMNSTLSAQTVYAGDHFKKVVWIVFENIDYSKALAQPDFNSITKNSLLFTNLTAEAHPSQGNYIAMIAGSKLNVINDSVIDLKETHVGDLLEKANLKWKVYAEDYPGKCFTGKSSGQYVRKHVPFMSFLNVTQSSSRCLNIEDETNFFPDYNQGTLPEFSMYIPNMKNDGHDTGVEYAGKWLGKNFGQLLSNPAKLGDVLFIITFDESGSSSKTNQIYTVMAGSKIRAGTQNAQAINHTALLKMVEDEFMIGNLGRDDAKAPVLEGLWK